MPDIIYLPNSREGSVLTFGQKRLREELKCDPEVIPELRDLWLMEGNIIVVVRNRAFRVHKSTLISRSDVLRDHLALSSRETIVWTAGSVAVPLEGVSPDDVRCLFQVMFCSKNYYYQGDAVQPVPFSVLNALIRLGHKYRIKDVFNDAMGRLQKYYTRDLRWWDHAAERARYVQTTPADVVSVIELARLTNTPALLPTAFYMCSAKLSDSGAPFHNASAILSKLPPHEMAHLFRGSSRLLQECVHRVCALAEAVPCSSCPQPNLCHVTARLALKANATVSADSPSPSGVRMALEPFENWYWRKIQGRSVCDRCMAAWRDCDNQWRARLWSTLPEIFEIQVEGWTSSMTQEVEFGERQLTMVKMALNE